MGRKDKQRAKKTEHEEEEEHGSPMGSTPPLVFEVSSDDEEANEDLSLGIVEKALMRRKLPRNDVVSNGDDAIILGASSSRQDEVAVARNEGVLNEAREVVDVSDSEELKSERKKKSKSKKKKVKKVESEEHNVVTAEGQVTIETVETTKPIKEAENDEPAEEPAMVQMGDNAVLRKLLRGPRYFDAPDSGGWGACYNCGEEGHAAVNCTAAKRKKPCYVCCSLEHNAKNCTMGRDCYICKKGGHRAKDCPEKNLIGSQSLKICLKCGDSGHEMFSCKNDYSPDDLKEVQCYVCKKFGHLCCVNTADSTPRVISCYQCGQLGHTGLACARLRTEAADAATPSSCYRCGEAGHFARECTSSVKLGKRRRESSNTKTPKFQKENDYVGHRSAPHDIGKSWKKKKPFTEEKGLTTPRKPKHRGGWMTEHPAEFSPSKSKRSSWRSPATPPYKSSKVHSFRNESYTPKSNSSKIRKFHDPSPTPRRSPHSYQTRFSASRFGHSSSDGYGRSYNWW
ncbi:hypothetical protein HN51_024059 [Arachis hypogaea]|uniref:uncharacterized protein n=1 Tax=Arachis hypogaea TaxID=3818 RepID=UPI000DEC91C9|nr:protein AIR2 [Arachis hypogaea]